MTLREWKIFSGTGETVIRAAWFFERLVLAATRFLARHNEFVTIKIKAVRVTGRQV